MGFYLCPYKTTRNMETANNSTRTDWILFLISAAVMTYMLLYVSEWFWVALPFVLTYFVKAVRAI